MDFSRSDQYFYQIYSSPSLYLCPSLILFCSLSLSSPTAPGAMAKGCRKQLLGTRGVEEGEGVWCERPQHDLPVAGSLGFLQSTKPIV